MQDRPGRRRRRNWTRRPRTRPSAWVGMTSSTKLHPSRSPLPPCLTVCMYAFVCEHCFHSFSQLSRGFIDLLCVCVCVVLEEDPFYPVTSSLSPPTPLAACARARVRACVLPSMPLESFSSFPHQCARCCCRRGKVCCRSPRRFAKETRKKNANFASAVRNSCARSRGKQGVH